MNRIPYSNRHSNLAVAKALAALKAAMHRVDVFRNVNCPHVALSRQCRALIAHDRTINGLS